MLPWVMILVIVMPDGIPHMFSDRTKTEFACQQLAEAIRSTRPKAAYVLKCLDIGQMLGTMV